jgi:hypothetical protein
MLLAPLRHVATIAIPVAATVTPEFVFLFWYGYPIHPNKCRWSLLR